MAETMTGDNQEKGAQPDMRRQEGQEGWSVPIDRIAAFTSGASLSVEPAQIEKELSALWRQAAERARSTGSQLAVTRACLWNLVVLVRGEQDFRRLKGVLDDFSEHVPTRLIVLVELPDAAAEPSEPAGHDDGPDESPDDSPIRSFVEANFRQGPDGRRELIAEEITLMARGQEVRRLPALVRSLLLPDLPTGLYVYGALPERQLLSLILQEVDRLIIDTGKQPDVAALHRLGEALSAVHVSAEVADLGWLRLYPWRTMVASLFDPPEARPALEALSEVQVRYATGAEPEAYLLGGWLATQLNLGAVQGQRDGGLHARSLQLLDKTGRTVNLLLSHADAQEAAGGIVEVILRSGDQVFRATAAGPQSVELHSPLLPPQVQLVRGRRDAELLFTALGVSGRDPLMYEALCHSMGLCPR